MTTEAVWEERISALAKTIERLTTATERLAMVTERVSVLEEKHQNQGAAVGRAFGEIATLRDEFHGHENEARELVAKYCAENDRSHEDIVEKNDGEHKAIVEENEKEHRVFYRYIWIATGFCTAAVVFWSLFGFVLKQSIDEQMKIINEIRVHLYEDKIKTADDVRAVHKSIESESRR